MEMICVFGDSISKGVVLDEVRRRYGMLKESFVNLAGHALSVVPRNYSKFGCTVCRGAEMVNGHSEDIANSAYTLLEFGGNDSDFNWAAVAEDPHGNHLPNTPPDLFYRTYDDVIKRILAEGGHPVLLNLPPVAHHKFFNWFMADLDKQAVLTFLGGSDEFIYRWHEMYNTQVETLARRNNVPLIDIRTPFLALRDYDDYFCMDGTHPNEKGHALISLTIQRAAKDFL